MFVPRKNSGCTYLRDGTFNFGSGDGGIAAAWRHGNDDENSGRSGYGDIIVVGPRLFCTWFLYLLAVCLLKMHIVVASLGI